jgi:hypothetical protein
VAEKGLKVALFSMICGESVRVANNGLTGGRNENGEVRKTLKAAGRTPRGLDGQRARSDIKPNYIIWVLFVK